MMKVLEKMMVLDVAEHQRRKTNAHNNLVENMQKSMRKPIPKRRQNVVKRDRGPPPQLVSFTRSHRIGTNTKK